MGVTIGRGSWTRRALGAAVCLVAAACGGTSRNTIEDTTETPTSVSSVSSVAAGVGSGGDVALAVKSATARLRDATAFRLTMSTGQVLRSSGLGLDTVQEIDPDRPTSVAEIAADGSQHVVLDLGPVFGALASGNPEMAEAVDSAHVEMWADDTQILIDATGFQPIADLNPSYDFGPFAPGIGTIDLTRLGDTGQIDLVELLVGNGIADPVELADRLPTALTGIQQDPDDISVYTASTTYATIIDATGGDIEFLAKGAASPVANALQLDAQDLVAFYIKFYESAPADVIITIGDDGALSSLQITTDLSSISDQLFDPDAGLDFGRLTDEEMAQAREAFADTTWILEMLLTFELDDAIAVTPPGGDFEDRTDIAARYFDNVMSG